MLKFAIIIKPVSIRDFFRSSFPDLLSLFPFQIFLQIASSSKCKKEELALAVTFAGGKIISKLPKLKRDNALDDDDDDQHCDFILVGDNITLNRSVMARAGALGIPCVTQRYFNQCVTHGEILDPSIYTFKYESPKKS